MRLPTVTGLGRADSSLDVSAALRPRRRRIPLERLSPGHAGLVGAWERSAASATQRAAPWAAVAVLAGAVALWLS